jgi:hypothetical protein
VFVVNTQVCTPALSLSFPHTIPRIFPFWLIKSISLNGGDPMNSSDQRLSGDRDFKVVQGLMTRQRSRSPEVNLSH